MNLELVPDKDEPDAGQIYINASLDGNVQKYFLDSGATSTRVVTNQFFATYAPIKSANISGISGEGVRADRILIKSVSIGKYDLGEHSVVRLPQGLEVVPTIGIDVFQQKKIMFDFKDKTLGFPEQTGNTAFQVGKAGHVLVSGFSGAPMQMIWDTGAGLTTIDNKVISAHPENFELIKNINAGDTVSAKAMQVKLYKAKRLKLGSIEIENVKVLGVDLTAIKNKLGDPVDGALGYNVITKHDWFFDLQNKLYSVQ